MPPYTSWVPQPAPVSGEHSQLTVRVSREHSGICILQTILLLRSPCGKRTRHSVSWLVMVRQGREEHVLHDAELDGWMSVVENALQMYQSNRIFLTPKN